jgi:hypothetical protein
VQSQVVIAEVGELIAVACVREGLHLLPMCTMNLCFSNFWMVLKVCPPRRLPIRVISSADTYSWFRMPISIAARIRSYSREMKCRY